MVYFKIARYWRKLAKQYAMDVTKLGDTHTRRGIVLIFLLGQMFKVFGDRKYINKTVHLAFKLLSCASLYLQRKC